MLHKQGCFPQSLLSFWWTMNRQFTLWPGRFCVTLDMQSATQMTAWRDCGCFSRDHGIW